MRSRPSSLGSSPGDGMRTTRLRPPLPAEALLLRLGGGSGSAGAGSGSRISLIPRRWFHPRVELSMFVCATRKKEQNVLAFFSMVIKVSAGPRKNFAHNLFFCSFLFPLCLSFSSFSSCPSSLPSPSKKIFLKIHRAFLTPRIFDTQDSGKGNPPF